MLHTFEELRSTGDQVVRLLQRAKSAGDWDLCKELARFLMALDPGGATLRKTLEMVELKSPSAEVGDTAFSFDTTTARLGVPSRGRRTNGGEGGLGAGTGFALGEGSSASGESSRERSPASAVSPGESAGGRGYFDAAMR